MITFDPLWRTLKSKGMNKGDLQKLTGRSSSTMAKLSKNEVVKLDVVERICTTLQVPIYNVLEITAPAICPGFIRIGSLLSPRI